ncbi:MAG TPA: sigma-70 family RNA polymerase sigma factor [Methanosarcina sp.]|nr:sigma-70 family RNA polymerase sigma factor [Methanosarcina sp.]
MDSIIRKFYLHNYKNLVKRIKYRTNNNEADAEDVVQEAFTRALKYKNSFEMGLPFNLWFSRILSNALKDWKREQFNNPTPDDFEDGDSVPAEDSTMRRKLMAKIKEEILSLDNEGHKEVLMLNMIYGFKLREVVVITDLKYKTVDQIVQRFKNAMKEKYVDL